MLLEIDRVQLAVPEKSSVVGRWQALLNAEITGAPANREAIAAFMEKRGS
jgi:thiamine phosphate synthase YjbQ (UPF0047 family)